MWTRTTLAIILFGIIFGIAGTAYLNDKGIKGRQPASIQGKKLWMPAPAGKHLAPLKVAIEEPSFIPEKGDDTEVTLVGRILVNHNINSSLTYSWDLPAGVEAVRGELKSNVSGVQSGQTVDVSLTVTGFNKEKQKLIVLKALAVQGQEILGNSALIASRPEDTWESIAPELKRSADEQLGPASEKNPEAQTQ